MASKKPKMTIFNFYDVAALTTNFFFF